ncbi:toxin-antitoxin system YwqK family antitoxin [Pontibacter populi]|uniref:Toxin-antitoxin system YwqK family antitoxin n=1 Tax=Pontibacter populi TaxID=890055 RepID=A0ABV1RWW6_9BACT
MKIFLFLLLCYSSGLGNEIKYNLYLKNPCLNEVEISFNYYLEKDGKQYHISDFKTGTVLLPKKGQYILVSTGTGDIQNIQLNEEVNSDTLTIPRIQEYLVTHDKHGYIFRNCDKPSDGLQKSYYSDGSIKLIGEFKEGLVVGVLKEFYHNGKIKQISNYTKDGFLTKTTRFDENGKIIKE